MLKDFYCVWNPKHGAPTYQHDTLHRATAEAERLAKLNPGQNFYVLGTMALATVPAPPLTITYSKSNVVKIPF